MRESASSPSNLGCALLGLLARQPATGYDLAKRMERPVGYFWTAHHSQIYPELSRLEEAGLVQHAVVEGAGPRPTKRYAVTPAGRAALRAWLASDMEPQPVRDLETLRLWSIWTVDAETARSLVTQARARHTAALAAYQGELDGIVDDPRARDPSHPMFASRLTLEGGVRSRRAAVEWCDWMAAELG
jgi:DNA-binding PadR family transcriptional regulator